MGRFEVTVYVGEGGSTLMGAVGSDSVPLALFAVLFSAME